MCSSDLRLGRKVANRSRRNRRLCATSDLVRGRDRARCSDTLMSVPRGINGGHASLLAPERDRLTNHEAVKFTTIVSANKARPAAIKAERPKPDASL